MTNSSSSSSLASGSSSCFSAVGLPGNRLLSGEGVGGSTAEKDLVCLSLSVTQKLLFFVKFFPQI
jgi:hypothetical protein